MNKQMLDLNGDIFIDFGSKLGAGAYGDVYKGMWKSQNRLVAIKKIKQQHENALEMMEEQVQIMRQFKHQNVLDFLDIIRHKQGLFLIIEYCEGGNLASQISKQPIPELNCFYYFKSLISGMAQINKLKHIHRDLKPQNILFTKYKQLKICDFGLARRIIGNDVDKMQKYSAKGSPLYASPQLLNGQQFSGKCDVWSAGLILVEMLTKQCPVYNRAKVKDQYSLMKYQKEVTSKTGFYVFEGNYNKWFKEVVAMMLAYDESNRASFAQIKEKIDKDEKALILELGGFGNFGNVDINANIPIGTATITNSVVKVNPENKNMTYNQLEDMNRIEQLANNLQFYLKYLYNRAKIFVDMATKFYQIKSQYNGAIKYIVLYLTIGYYLKSIEFLEKLITNVKTCQLPNGDLIDSNIFSKLDGSYLKLLTEQKSKFYATVASINERLTSEKYTSAFPQLLQKHGDLITELKKLSTKQSTLSADDFQRLYTKFIKQQVLEPNAELKNEDFGRLYWLTLTLTNVQKVLPVKQFANNYIINEIVDYSSKADYNKLLKNIEELRSEIASK